MARNDVPERSVMSKAWSKISDSCEDLEWTQGWGKAARALHGEALVDGIGAYDIIGGVLDVIEGGFVPKRITPWKREYMSLCASKVTNRRSMPLNRLKYLSTMRSAPPQAASTWKKVSFVGYTAEGSRSSIFQVRYVAITIIATIFVFSSDARSAPDLRADCRGARYRSSCRSPPGSPLTLWLSPRMRAIFSMECGRAPTQDYDRRRL